MSSFAIPTFSGVYLPLLWERSFCWKSPIALGYTRGHFSALVAMETDVYDNRGAGANLKTDDDVTVTFLPLVDSERKLLHIHFLSAQEVRHFPHHMQMYIHEHRPGRRVDGWHRVLGAAPP